MAYNFDVENIRFTDGSLKGKVRDADQDPNNVIELGTTCFVDVEWSIDTSDSWVLNNTSWLIDVYAEAIGPGPELVLAHATKPAMPPDVIQPGKLFWKLTIPFNTAAPNLQFKAGAYKMVIVLTHTATVNGTPKKTRMAGFYEIPMVQFYEHEV